MLKKVALVSIFVASFCGAETAVAVDIAAGKSKADMMCVACHGKDGISMIPMYPNLKGQKAAYTAKQLKAFKNKTRVDPVMAGMAGGLTDADIDNLSAYYESLK